MTFPRLFFLENMRHTQKRNLIPNSRMVSQSFLAKQFKRSGGVSFWYFDTNIDHVLCGGLLQTISLFLDKQQWKIETSLVLTL